MIRLDDHDAPEIEVLFEYRRLMSDRNRQEQQATMERPEPSFDLRTTNNNPKDRRVAEYQIPICYAGAARRG